MADQTITPAIEYQAMHYRMFDGERSQTRDLSDMIVITRKPHTCVICQEVFPSGSTARALRQIDMEGHGGNRVMTFYACPDCIVAMAKSFDPVDPDYGAAILARHEIGARRAERRRGAENHQYSWIGADHPPGWKCVGTIDVADPADVSTALDQCLRIGTIYDGGSSSVAEPCAADVYKEIEERRR